MGQVGGSSDKTFQCHQRLTSSSWKLDGLACDETLQKKHQLACTPCVYGRLQRQANHGNPYELHALSRRLCLSYPLVFGRRSMVVIGAGGPGYAVDGI